MALSAGDDLVHQVRRQDKSKETCHFGKGIGNARLDKPSKTTVPLVRQKSEPRTISTMQPHRLPTADSEPAVQGWRQLGASDNRDRAMPGPVNGDMFFPVKNLGHRSQPFGERSAEAHI